MTRPALLAVSGSMSTLSRMIHKPRENFLDNLRRKKCCWCDSELVRPYFVIEQEVRLSTEYWHTIVVLCDDCKRGQLERTYRDSSDWETTFEQTEWYKLEEGSVKQLRDFIEQKAQRFAPCPDPLSAKCLCDVHWQLTEAAQRLEPLSDDEIRRLHSVAPGTFSFAKDSFPKFERSN